MSDERVAEDPVGEVAGLTVPDAINTAADTLRANLVPLSIGSFFYLVFTSGVEAIGRVMRLQGQLPSVELVLGIQLVSQLIGGLLMLGLVKMSQDALEGREVRVADLVMSYRLLWKGVVAVGVIFGSTVVMLVLGALVVGVATRGGPVGLTLAWCAFLGLATAMTYVALGLSLAVYEIVYDPGVGPIEALRRSWRMSRGHRFTLLGLGVASLFAFLLGALACGVGIVVSYAYMFLLFGAAHRALRREIGLRDAVAPSAF